MRNNIQKIYLDYAATTPVDPAVLRAMQPYFSVKFGNPGSLHSFGQAAIAAVDGAREAIAGILGVEFREVIFTGSATEANNFVMRSVVQKSRRKGIAHPRIIISSIEHESILETAKLLERDGVEVIYIPVYKSGIVDVKKIKESLTENTVLVSVMYVNNEIGSVQPIGEIARIIKEFNDQSGVLIPFHTDASQALHYLPCTVDALGVDAMTISSHKVYGPKGVAALCVRKGIVGDPLVIGGGQEFGFRSGTENVPAIVGFGKAVQMAIAIQQKEVRRIMVLRDYFIAGLKGVMPKVQINGFLRGSYAPHIVNAYFPGHAAQDMLTRLDLAGIAVSSGSACRSRAMERSYVIDALGHSAERAKSSVRFSFGRFTTKRELLKTLQVLKKIL